MKAMPSRVGLRFLLLSFSIISSLAFAKSAIYDVTGLVSGTEQRIALIAGKSVQIKTPLTDGVRILFVDKHPEANWGHPAAFRVLSAEDKLLEEINIMLPPASLSKAKVISRPIEPMDSPVNWNVKDLEKKYHVTEPDRYYAFLINGRGELRHWNDFSFLYRVLLKVYGYKKENIFVADSAYRHRNPDLDGDGWEDIQYGSTKEDIAKIFGMLNERMKPTDHLLLAINDHGSTSPDGESTIVLKGGEMKASEFGVFLKALPVKTVLSIYEQCFSGGFVRPSVGSKRVSMAAATDQEYSWASMDMKFNEFFYHVVTAFARQNHEGMPIKTDINGDGRITAHEAFAYGVANDRRRESPFMETGPNAGASRTVGLGFIQ